METKQKNIELIAKDWINYHKDNRKYTDCFRALEKLEDYIYSNQESAFEIILLLINKADSDKISANIAAGPLEDFIRIRHKKHFDKIEMHARQNPKFRKCLTGVWLDDDFDEEKRNIIMKYTKTIKNPL